MGASAVYLAIGLVALLAVAVLALVLGRRPDATALTPLAALSFGMLVAGIVFGESRAVGYTFVAVGIGLALVDLVRKRGSHGSHRGGGAGGHGARGV